MQEKSDRKLEFLLKRESDRKTDYKSKREDNEKTDFFERSFNEKKFEIETHINEAEGKINPKECAEHFNRIFKDILDLQKYVAASNIFLRTYDIKIYQQSIQELTNKAKEIEMKLLPKKKFGFKNKKQEIKRKLPATNGKIEHKIILDENFCGYKNESNKTLTLNAEILKKDVTLSNLANCTVKLFGTPSTLHMSYLSNCKIFAGPVSTSIFADDCKDCTLVISCQQLRLHSSENVRIYLHVTSRAIMEDCNRITLAPYNLTYEGIDGHYADSGLDRNVNNWRCVDDFNWLNVEKRSPHWSVLEENERVNDWKEAIL